MARGTALALSVAVLCLVAYLLTFGGKFYSIDEEIYLRMTHSLVRTGSFAIEPIEYAKGFSTELGLDGRYYGNRGPAFPIAAIPFFNLGDALTQFGPGYTEPSPDGIGQPTVFTLALTLANTVIVALTVFLLFATVSRLGYNHKVAAAVALLFGLGTMVWPYASKSFFGEPLLMLCTLGSFYWALRYRLDAQIRHRPSYVFLALSAICLGCAILTKVTGIILAPFLGWYLLSASLDGRIDRRRLWTAALAFGVVALTFVAILGWYNFARFGSLIKTGYEVSGQGSESLLIGSPADLMVGLYGLLLSPGKGLLFHAVPVVLAVAGLSRFWRTHRSEAIFIVSASAATIFGVVLWRDWSGGWCWGPRLILNALPLLMIPAAAAIDSQSWSRGWRRLVWPIFLGLGMVTQLIGVLPDYLAWYLRVGNHNLVYYNPLYAPLRGHLEAILRGEIDLFWMKTGLFFPSDGPIMAAIPIGLAAMALASVLAVAYFWSKSVSREVLTDERADSAI